MCWWVIWCACDGGPLCGHRPLLVLRTCVHEWMWTECVCVYWGQSLSISLALSRHIKIYCFFIFTYLCACTYTHTTPHHTHTHTHTHTHSLKESASSWYRQIPKCLSQSGKSLLTWTHLQSRFWNAQGIDSPETANLIKWLMWNKPHVNRLFPSLTTYSRQ